MSNILPHSAGLQIHRRETGHSGIQPRQGDPPERRKDVHVLQNHRRRLRLFRTHGCRCSAGAFSSADVYPFHGCLSAVAWVNARNCAPRLLDADYFYHALQSVKTVDSSGKEVYPVKSINVLKAHGKSARESALLNGYALNMGRASQGMPKRVANAKIACLDMNLQKTRMHMGIQVLLLSHKCLLCLLGYFDMFIRHH